MLFRKTEFSRRLAQRSRYLHQFCELEIALSSSSSVLGLERYCYTLDNHLAAWQNGVKATHAGLWKRDLTQQMLIIGIGMLLHIIVLIGISLSRQFAPNNVYQRLIVSQSADILFTLFNVLKLFYRTEKNACVWSQEKLKEFFVNSKIEGEGGWYHVFINWKFGKDIYRMSHFNCIR